jgi:hypothetical protein
MKHVEEEASRIASCAPPTDCVLWQSEETPTMIEVSVETSSKTVEETEKTGEEFGGEKESTEVSLDDATNTLITLVLCAYSESQRARSKLELLIRNALNSAVDLVFILNGSTNVAAIITRCTQCSNYSTSKRLQ